MRLHLELSRLKTRWSYNQATVSELYKVAFDVLSKVTKNTNLTDEQRYDVMHELNDLLNVHIFYRIRMTKNSQEFMKNFDYLWTGLVVMPAEDEKYSLVQKATGSEGGMISLFWNDRDNFLYSVLSEREHIFKLIEDEYLSIKKAGSYSGDLFQLATKFQQTLITYLGDHPQNAFAKEMSLSAQKIEEIIKSINQ
ncbi:MAG: hypothetical protein WAW11_05195 [Patescibacteria group bacterium]